MRLITFDPFRTLGLPGVRYIKPELMNRHLADIRAADCLLFPGYWQLNTLHYVLRQRIFPSPVTYHLGHDKVEMTRAFQVACPEHVPHTEILASTPENVRDVLQRWPLPFVAKVVRASQGLGVYLIDNAAQFEAYAQQNEVLYVQQRLPIERDLRIVVVGREIVAAYWREGADFHNNVSRGGVVRLELPVPSVATDFVLSLSQYLDIDHAGFDIAMVEGTPMLLEFNRLFGHQGIPGLAGQVADATRRYLFGDTAPPPGQQQRA
ncbi:ATP-grasp domain-containing protein [Isoalcanivorax indicus]|uniref:ATP-grasp domain-containing protein n=1 Tax=Isoalcanivorax indicus TaxID=2202653 RepID=UPI000DB91DE5|nr:hypothetical protein [Isoalcanivorax indicus]